MSAEYQGSIPKAEMEQEKKSSSKRMMLAFEALIKLQVGEISIQGRDHIKEIPPEKKVIIAVTHISDLDVPLAVTALGQDFDIAVANMSVHHSLNPKKGEPSTYFGLVAAGKDNFIPLDFKKDSATGDKQAQSFNPENFDPMLDALNKGKSLLIAAHNPSHDFKVGHAGYGAAYLAELADAIILPVAVKIKSENGVGMYGAGVKTFANKPDAEINIGMPFELEKIPEIDQINKLLKKRKSGVKLRPEEREKFSELSTLLRNQSEKVLSKVSTLLES